MLSSTAVEAAVVAADIAPEARLFFGGLVVVAGSAFAAGPVVVVLLWLAGAERFFVIAIHEETEEHCRQGLPDGSRTMPEASFL